MLVEPNKIYLSEQEVEVIDRSEYKTDLTEFFSDMPAVARPLLKSAEKAFTKLEEMLYSAPSFINMVRAHVPEQTFQTVLSKDQKAKLASGALQLMTKKDGSLTANLVNPKTKKIISTISLQEVSLSPAIAEAMTSYGAQMQLAQIAEQIQEVQQAVEEVRQGQEADRLATAYSCQQKLLQAAEIKNPELKAMALLRIVSDAEDSRNLLMQSQAANIAFIKGQPESFIGKFLSGAKNEKINQRMQEIRESLNIVNLISLTEAMAYEELGEREASKKSLQYYADYIEKTYLETEGFVERLDMIDPAPENYWSEIVPKIQQKIQALPGVNQENRLEGGNKFEKQ